MEQAVMLLFTTLAEIWQTAGRSAKELQHD
jgi:hypothetical protein